MAGKDERPVVLRVVSTNASTLFYGFYLERRPDLAMPDARPPLQ